MENNELGAYHLADNPELYDVQRTNVFQFVVTGLEDLVNVSSGEKIGNAQKSLQIAVESATVPTFSQDPIVIKRGNSAIKYAGTPTWNDIKITLRDFIGAETKAALMSWQNLSYSVNSDKVLSSKNYKKTCYLIEYTSDYKKVRTWKIFGAWIKSWNPSEFNQESDDYVKIDVELSYDRAVMELPEEA